MTAYVDYVLANFEGYVSLVKGAAGGNETLRAIYEEARVGAVRADLHRGRPGRADRRHPAQPRLIVRGWAAMTEELVIAWSADPAGEVSPRRAARRHRRVAPALVESVDDTGPRADSVT